MEQYRSSPDQFKGVSNVLGNAKRSIFLACLGRKRWEYCYWFQALFSQIVESIAVQQVGASEPVMAITASVPIFAVLPVIQIHQSLDKEAVMTIYCMHCGTQLPDIASFCLKCGKPVKDATTSNVQPEPRWEYCEIVCQTAGFLGRKSYFAGQSVGAQGVYIAARSTKTFGTIPTSRGDAPETNAWGSERKSKEALNELIAILSADGWQPSGKGEEWWEYKYRRQVSSSGSPPTISSSVQVETKEQWIKKGMTFLDKGQYNEAKAAFEHAIQLDFEAC